MKASIFWLFGPLLAAQNGGIVEGTAVNRVTGVGVPGVTVKLEAVRAPHNILQTAVSDAAGAFRMKGLPAGDYTASFDAPEGFAAPSFWEPPCKPFHVTEGGRAAKLEVPMQPLSTLHVRVIDSQDRPVPKVRVEFVVATSSSSAGAIGETDSEGRFSESGIHAGAYYLRARPILPGTPLAQQSKLVSELRLKPPEGERWMWAPTYFPGAVERAAAQTIVVREGAVLPEYVVRLRAAPVYRLRGTIADEEGRPVPGAAVKLRSENTWGAAEAQAASGSDGSFELPSVRTGEWQIVVEAKRGSTMLKGFTQLAMPQRDLEDIAVRIAPPFTFDAVAEGLPRQESSRYIALYPANGIYDQKPEPKRKPDGAWRFEEIYAGRYLVGEYGAPSGYYLKSILMGTQDVTARVLELTPESPPLKLIYKSGAATVWGSVENGAGAKVVLVDAGQENYIPGQDIQVAVCDQSGRFTLAGLRPATYYAFAFAIAGVNSGAVREAVFRLGLSQQGKTISLAADESARLDLKITPFPAELQRP